MASLSRGLVWAAQPDIPLDRVGGPEPDMIEHLQSRSAGAPGAQRRGASPHRYDKDSAGREEAFVVCDDRVRIRHVEQHLIEHDHIECVTWVEGRRVRYLERGLAQIAVARLLDGDTRYVDAGVTIGFGL